MRITGKTSLAYSLLNYVSAVMLTYLVTCPATLPARASAYAEVQATSAPVSKPTKRALLIGINNYKYPDRVSSLSGSVNDVEDMRQVLIGKYEFLPENILVLKDAQATHAGIMAAIQTHLIAKSQPGDIVVFHYSGHGSQMKDVTGKMISGLDETLVPYDSRDPEGKVFDISGAEMHASLVQLAQKTKNVTFILDSCHSGTLVRGARVRFIPADTREVSPQVVSATRGLSTPDDAATPKFVSISAATSREVAFEHFAEGADHGSLTYFLTRKLRSAPAGATYRDVMDSVIGSVTANYPAQHPSLEGVEADQNVFGDSTSLAGNYVIAAPSQLDSAKVTLNVGKVQGATVGSVYDVFAPGSRKFTAPEKPIARVQLASVDALSAEASVLSGKVTPASRAVEREHRFGPLRTRVFLDGVEDSPTLQAVRDGLANVKNIELVDRPTLCNLQLRQSAGSIQTLAADASTLSPPVRADDPQVAARRLIGQLQQWAKWFNVLSIHNLQSDVAISFDMKGKQTRDPMARIGKPDMGVAEGDTVTVTLTNNGERDLYVAMLDLSSDGSVSVVYPSEQGVKEVLKPHATLSRSFVTTLPKGRGAVTDVLKAFVSYKPLDLSPLTQAMIRGVDGPADTTAPADDPLEALLLDSAGDTRGLAAVGSKPAELGTWATVQRVLVIKRKI